MRKAIISALLILIVIGILALGPAVWQALNIGLWLIAAILLLIALVSAMVGIGREEKRG